MNPKIRGYVTNREFGGLRVPAPIQNVYIRDYLAKNNREFVLSVGEYAFSNCYVQLEKVMDQLGDIQGIAMCSMFMLPQDPLHRKSIYERVIDTKSELHLILESLVIKAQKDVALIEEVLQLSQVQKDCPTKINPEFLESYEHVDRFV